MVENPGNDPGTSRRRLSLCTTIKDADFLAEDKSIHEDYSLYCSKQCYTDHNIRQLQNKTGYKHVHDISKYSTHYRDFNSSFRFPGFVM